MLRHGFLKLPNSLTKPSELKTLNIFAETCDWDDTRLRYIVNMDLSNPDTWMGESLELYMLYCLYNRLISEDLSPSDFELKNYLDDGVFRVGYKDEDAENVNNMSFMWVYNEATQECTVMHDSEYDISIRSERTIGIIRSYKECGSIVEAISMCDNEPYFYDDLYFHVEQEGVTI